MLKPLRLSRRDRKTLIHDHLTPLSKLIINPDDIYCAIEHNDQQAFPSQICDNCAPGLFKHYGYRVADAGWCSQCHERGECLDVALIEHYRKYGIDDYTICRYLPRKRYQSNVCPLPLRYQSIDDIEKAHQTLFNAFKIQKRLGDSTLLAR
ncbi:hypothetical protein BCT92_13795 [Vibrio sp. 10N.261.52.E5]|uniref:Uncharacterized protein n=1 Tax=Vibrio cyclitrophicus TaxID=47951 RepID=A0A7Z1RZN4_9VIBR|nr:hypothetical protein BCT92_13795 [Vibrio sp. 10N.261.52.E5]PMP22846.1 hypothetical protein BCS91_15770 [Vibrio cyclitrophicus]PMP24884.1 hypothetical protein BCS90_24945 [Vibrio cyclitrophicus]